MPMCSRGLSGDGIASGAFGGLAAALCAQAQRGVNKLVDFAGRRAHFVKMSTTLHAAWDARNDDSGAAVYLRFTSISRAARAACHELSGLGDQPAAGAMRVLAELAESEGARLLARAVDGS